MTSFSKLSHLTTDLPDNSRKWQLRNEQVSGFLKFPADKEVRGEDCVAQI